MKRWVPFAALAALAIGYMALSPLLQSQRSVLEQSDEFTLLSLNPYEMGPNAHIGGQKFHNHRILGQTKITNPRLKAQLVDTLFRGMSENSGRGACFKPRQGIRARRGWRTVEVVICFECGHVYFSDWRGRSNSVGISDSPRALFDATLRAARVRVAASTH